MKRQAVCLECEGVFDTARKQQKYCSRKCFFKIHSPNGYSPWSESEDKLMRLWLTKKRTPQIVREWNKAAQKRGWPVRSENAIRVKIFRERAYMDGEIQRTDAWTQDNLEKALDIGKTRINGWIEKGLKADLLKWGHTGMNIFYKKDLVQFAKSFPQEFGGIDPSKLGRILGDHKLAQLIAKDHPMPRWREIVVIRLDTGDVYKTIKNAARELSLTIESISIASIRATPMRNGMDWTRLEYPTYWVPSALRDEFNEVAARLLIEIYNHFSQVAGYSKLSCLVVASRLAVQITLIAFRRHSKQKDLGEVPSPVNVISDYWVGRFLNLIDNFSRLNESQMFSNVMSAIKWKAYPTFRARLPSASQAYIDRHLQEFALWYIEDVTKHFLRKNYLPTGYKPSTRLEKADFFSYIYSSCSIYIETNLGKKFSLLRLKAFNYLDRRMEIGTVVLDFSGTADCDEDAASCFCEAQISRDKWNQGSEVSA